MGGRSIQGRCPHGFTLPRPSWYVGPAYGLFHSTDVRILRRLIQVVPPFVAPWGFSGSLVVPAVEVVTAPGAGFRAASVSVCREEIAPAAPDSVMNTTGVAEAERIPEEEEGNKKE